MSVSTRKAVLEAAELGSADHRRPERDPGGATELQELRKLVQIVFLDPFGSLNPGKKIAAIPEEPVAAQA